MAGEPNPAAIAWYLAKSESLLDELREQVQSLRIRGGRLAGFSGAVLALAGANAKSILDALHGPARDCAGVSLLIGSLLLIASLAVALRGTLLPQLGTDISPSEVANFTSDRFTHEPDLWRIHIRAIHGLALSIELSTRQGDEAARAMKMAEYIFIIGLISAGVALAILIAAVTF